MANLASRFLTARPAQLTELSDGSWVLTDQVRTQAFLTGGTGPDEVQSDSTGLRTDSTKQFHWLVEFRIDSSGRLLVHQNWGGRETTNEFVASFGVDSTLVFALDIDADKEIRTSCRAASAQLICLDLQHPGDGMVLRRIRKQ